MGKIQPLKIAVDCDDVLNDLMHKTLALFEQDTGIHYDYQDLAAFNLETCLPIAHAKQIVTLFGDKRLWDSLAPVDGAQKALKRMVDDGHDVFIVTASHFSNVKWKYEWIQEHYPFIAWEQVIIARRKDLINSDWLIDDNPTNLLSRPYGRACITQPWNTHLKDEVLSILRADKLGAVYNLILEDERRFEDIN